MVRSEAQNTLSGAPWKSAAETTRDEKEVSMTTTTTAVAAGLHGPAAKKEKTRGRPQANTEKERINLSLSPRAYEQLDYLREKTEASSYTEVFRNAIRLYDALIQEAEKGNEFLVRDKEGNLTSYKIFY